MTQKTPQISAVVLTKNEERCIERCIKALSFCDEVVVLDDYSEDRTVSIARKLGARVIKHLLANNFAAQRNFALKSASFEWVLFIDADEVVSKSLAKEIKSATQTKNINGFLIKRQDIFFNKVMTGGEYGNQHFLRFGRKDSGSWTGLVHEVWNINGEVSKLKNPLLHYSHETLNQFIGQVIFHASLHTKNKYIKRAKSRYLYVLLYPLAKFFKNYFLLVGFRDGVRGFIYSVLMSFHSFLAWSNLWLLKK